MKRINEFLKKVLSTGGYLCCVAVVVIALLCLVTWIIQIVQCMI